MLITLLFIAMVLFGLILITIYMKRDENENLSTAAAIMTGPGIFLLIVSLITILVDHATANNAIEKNKIQYQGLLKRYEIVKSEYEDVSKSDVIADITAWNMEVYNVKYWTANPWTSWFNPRKIADNLYYIPLDEDEE